jgi:hypothetical protein
MFTLAGAPENLNEMTNQSEFFHRRILWYPCRGAEVFLSESGGLSRSRGINHRLMAVTPPVSGSTASRDHEHDSPITDHRSLITVS